MTTNKFVGLQEKLDSCVAELVKRHAIAVETLTEEQLAKVIKEAIECGDFKRFICNDGQSVCYIPFAQYDLMRSRNEFLEGEFRKRGIDPYGTDPNEKDLE